MSISPVVFYNGEMNPFLILVRYVNGEVVIVRTFFQGPLMKRDIGKV